MDEWRDVPSYVDVPERQRDEEKLDFCRGGGEGEEEGEDVVDALAFLLTVRTRVWAYPRCMDG